ncbi:MAG: restriction endonuclease subunit S [Thermoplasmata archaeon]|nr:restriction endonuclease subunit S [Thermoplasmata archaeon]
MKQKTKSKQSKIGKKYEIELSEKISVRDSINVKQKRPGYNRPIKEIFHGHKPSEDKEKYPLGVTEKRSIDRIKNTYDQVVKDNLTGEICHEEHEPLSAHKGRREEKIKAKFKQTEIGKIPEDWEVKPLAVECDINMGQSPPSRTYNSKGNGLPFLQGVKTFGEKYPYFDTYCSRPIKIAKKRSVLFSVRAPVGEVNIANTEICIGRGLASLSMKNSNNEFLFYLLKNYKKRIEAYQTGTTYGAISKGLLMNIKFAFPSEGEQKAIARILSSLDDKIELNQQMNKTLEAIAQAIFKHWFVDFEFPNEEGKPYKSSGGEMVYNEELGKEIPKGWRVGKLGEYIELDKGLSYKGKFLCEKEEGLPLINLGNIAPKFGFIYEALKYYKGEFKNRHLVKPGEIVIANTDITQRREVLGSPAIVPSDLRSEKILFTHHIYAVRNRSELPNTFLYYLLQLNGYRERVKGFATGTTVLALPRDAILDFKFTIPLKTILNLFTSTISLIQKRIDNNNLQKKSLSQIRDTLLPKLISGEIRVPVKGELKQYERD